MVMNKFICYPKCSTCMKAKKFLDEHNIKYEVRDIKGDNPSKDELDNFVKLSGKDINKFFNTSGLVYRSLGLKDKLGKMSYDEKLDVLASNGMIVKRPILVLDNKVLVGFNKQEWDNLIK